jgi:phosphoribosylformylglycinamidine synthase I
MRPRILILHVRGTNRDREVAWACELAGGVPEIVHINQLIAGERRLADYQMLVLPGGFSYGDDLGAGKLWAVALRHRLADELATFVSAGRPVLGICNGFQALVKSGLLPGADYMTDDQASLDADKRRARETVVDPRAGEQIVTLTRNDSARFECRWVYLQPQSDSPCIFTQGLDDLIYCPVAHSEGKFVARDDETLTRLDAMGSTALRYVRPDGHPAGYPWNPNGSQANVAGICNPEGTILGLMPHPEDHIMPLQHPRFHRGQRNFSGLPLFQNGVRYASNM